MFFDAILPYALGLALLALATVTGIGPARKLITIYEAKHELKHGSAGFLRSLSGWLVVAIWIMVTWFFATILGDWATHGDLADALERAELRLIVLLELAASLADN